MRSMRILIVEDEVIIAMGIQADLEQAGHVVTQIVINGEDAIKSGAQNPPDLVVMDNRLAGKMDGIETGRAILSERPLPIIFMTGYAAENFMLRAQELNPLGYLVKPLKMVQLRELIEAWGQVN
jgi:CheY-like chemotaxis protein